MRFRDRADAGKQLAQRLSIYAGRPDVLVLALPRGGVPVAAEVARALRAPLDVFLVRKLGVPGHPEFAMGAIAEGGVAVLNDEVIRSLGISTRDVHRVKARELAELHRRERSFRGTRPPPAIAGRTIILIDDGLATGSTVEAAIKALRVLRPARIVVAAPVGARESCARVGRLADEIVCVDMPEPFDAVGLWYADFSETSDDEVKALLRPAPQRTPVETIRDRAVRLTGDPRDSDALIARLGEARIVLLGEASHGTHEFYAHRAEITKRLIAGHGFAAVAVEADWPDAYRVNEYVRGAGTDRTSAQALAAFERFPAWMWRNRDVAAFVEWLRAHNATRPEGRRAGFYGLDLYSLHTSMRAVLTYLAKVDPEAAGRARKRYACFDRFGGEPQQYGYAASVGLSASCEAEVVAQLRDLQRAAHEYARRDGERGAADFFFAEQNARLVRNAEEYYRAMFHGRVASWNLRDQHMTDTLTELLAFLDRDWPQARVIVWAHNSHLGDARATELGEHGELNVGELVRTRFDASAALVGFTTYTGTVTAASEWDGPAETKTVRPALDGSYERLLHDAGLPACLLPLRDDEHLASSLAGPCLERAIGVMYLPATERQSHYFQARLPAQFDYVIHIDVTSAVEPLAPAQPAQHAEDVDETFPSGL